MGEGQRHQITSSNRQIDTERYNHLPFKCLNWTADSDAVGVLLQRKHTERKHLDNGCVHSRPT